MPESDERLPFQLPDPLPGEPGKAAHFVQGGRRSLVQPGAQAKGDGGLHGAGGAGSVDRLFSGPGRRYLGSGDETGTSPAPIPPLYVEDRPTGLRGGTRPVRVPPESTPSAALVRAAGQDRPSSAASSTAPGAEDPRNRNAMSGAVHLALECSTAPAPRHLDPDASRDTDPIVASDASPPVSTT
jgi:hypothetical protein